MSINNYYQIYLNKVLQLAETIVIKSTDTAELINRNISDWYGAGAVNQLDPYSWKYYLNLSGQYHSTDEPMHVVSMDTLEKITFSREQLELHRATLRGYQYGSRAYKELVAQYPKQEMLILGILYPADIDEAIAAADGKILAYPPNLVEPNEYSLIDKLQAWIDGYKVRWVNQQFGISDELYPATSLGIMYLNLVPTILNLRLEACKTNEAHSFHVRQYLASHGMLDAYMDHLSLKQTLFFYRNIAYIERNSGQKNIFEWLVEHIMSERNLPIAEYVARHDLTNQPDDLYPTLAFRRNPLNLGYSADRRDTISLEEILTKEDPLARDNFIYKEEHTADIQETMENSRSNVVLTKALESSMIDYSNSSPYTLEDILLAHWLQLASTDQYAAYIGITNPVTGERIPLTVKEAYVFMWFAFCESIGIKLNEIPAMYAKRVQRYPMVSVDEIMSVVDSKIVPRAIAVQALSMQPEITNIISTEAFYNLCMEIYNASQMQRNLKATQEHMVRRGMVHGMISRIYSDNVCRLEPEGKTFGQWFGERNIKIEDFNQAQLRSVYLDLVREATGMSLVTTNSLRALQASMVRMLAQLSSYSVQFMTQINNTDIRQTDWTSIRFGDEETHTGAHRYVPGAPVRVQDYDGKMKVYTPFDVNPCGVRGLMTIGMSQRAVFNIETRVGLLSIKDRRTARMESAPVRATGQTALPTNSEGIIPVFGIEHYLALTPTQRELLRNTQVS